MSWPDQVKNAMVRPQLHANHQAEKYEATGDVDKGFRVRVFGRINGIEDALIVLSQQLEEMHLASGR
jgi:hypothetical protein